MKQEVKPAEGKLGIMVVGCGAVATTFMTGVLMVRKGLSKPVGSMTQYDKIRVGRGAEKKYLHYGDIVPLAKLDDIVFGTWDAYPQNAYQAAVYAEVLKAKDIEPVRDELEKIVPIEIDEVDNRRMHLKFPPCLRSGDYPVICQGVEKAYGDHVVFSDVDLTIKRGEKVAFVGRNGEGKSTLVKCIMNEIPYGGTLKIGHNVQIGYFAQNQAQLLDERLMILVMVTITS